MAMWAVTVITLLPSSWGAVFLPPLLTVFFFPPSLYKLQVHSHRKRPSASTISSFSPLASLQVCFIFFAELMRLHSAGWGVSVCWWEAAGPLGSRMSGCRQTSRPPTASSQEINQLWFKLWYRKIINPQSVYLRSANKHHMLWRLSCSSKLWWSCL